MLLVDHPSFSSTASCTNAFQNLFLLKSASCGPKSKLKNLNVITRNGLTLLELFMVLRNLFPLFSIFSLLESHLRAESTIEVSRPCLSRSSLLLPANIGTADGLGDTGKYQGNTEKYRHFIEMSMDIQGNI